jgi:hypothetical protein
VSEFSEKAGIMRFLAGAKPGSNGSAVTVVCHRRIVGGMVQFPTNHFNSLVSSAFTSMFETFRAGKTSKKNPSNIVQATRDTTDVVRLVDQALFGFVKWVENRYSPLCMSTYQIIDTLTGLSSNNDRNRNPLSPLRPVCLTL